MSIESVILDATYAPYPGDFTATIDLDRPTTAGAQYLLIAHWTFATARGAPPNGFTQVFEIANDVSNHWNLQVYAKAVDGSEPSAWTLGLAVTSAQRQIAAAFSATSTAETVNDLLLGSATLRRSSLTLPGDFPSVTLSAPGALLLLFADSQTVQDLQQPDNQRLAPAGGAVRLAGAGLTAVADAVAYGRSPESAGATGVIEWRNGADSQYNVSQALYVSLGLDASPPPLPAPRVPVPDRYRASLAADSRSLLASTTAVPFDSSARVSFPPMVTLDQTEVATLKEVTRDQESETADVAFYPRAAQNEQAESEYDGVTLLTLMLNAFPAPVFEERLESVNADAQSIITDRFVAWAAEFPWFAYEAVPDLRTPSTSYTGTSGRVESRVVSFPQAGRDRVSMYDQLEALLSPFPGTVFFGTSEGLLRIVPVWGPAADAEPFRTLEGSDVTSVSVGAPSVGTIINRATVRSRGYQVSEDVEVMQPAWFQLGSRQLTGRDVWFTPPVDRVNLQEPSDSASTSLQADELTPADNYNEQTPGLWPVNTERLPAGPGISLVDSLGEPLVTVAWRQYCGGSAATATLSDSGTIGLGLIETIIPFDGAWRSTLFWGVNVGIETAQVTVQCRWSAARQGVEFRLADPTTLETSQALVPGCFWMVEFTLNDGSVGFVEREAPSVTFGIVAEGDSLPTTGGGNAILDSQNTFGVREEIIDVRGYALTVEQSRRIAEGYVLANITPRAVRELGLGWKGSTRVVFDDRGRLVGLPDGGEGLIVGRSYSDDFIAVAGDISLRVEETIPGSAGFIDTTTQYLLNDDGTFWQNDDGSFSEPA